MGPRLINRGNSDATGWLARISTASMGPRLINRGNPGGADHFDVQLEPLQWGRG